MKSFTLLYTRKVFRIATVCVVLVFVFRVFMFELGQVDGRSMESTVIDQEIFLVDKLSLLFRTPERGDIVQFFEPKSDVLLIKRVVGMPGERVKISGNSVSIIQQDGKEIFIEETYLDDREITDTLSKDTEVYMRISDHHYFVLGDNRNESIDSRHFGTVGRDTITGRLIHW